MKAASKLMVGLMAICSAIQCSDAFSLPSTNISNFTLQGEIYQASLERFQSQHHRLGNPQDISISRNQTEIGDGKLNLTNPYEAWEIYRKTEPGDFWTKDIVTTILANASDFFSDFQDDYSGPDTFKCRENGKSHVACFLQVYTGEHNFRCRIDQEHRCKFDKGSLPIMNHVDAMWPTFSIVDKVEMARKVYFTLLNLEEVMANMASNEKILSKVAAKLPALVPGLVKAFTPQPNSAALAACELTQQLLQAALKIGLKAVSMGLQYATPEMPDWDNYQYPIADIHKWDEKYAEGAKEATKTRSDKLSNVLIKQKREMLAKITQRNERAKMYFDVDCWRVKLQRAPWVKAVTTIEYLTSGLGMAWGLTSLGLEYGAAVSNPGAGLQRGIYGKRLGMTVSKATGMCGNDFGVAPDDNVQRAEETTKFVVEYIQALRFDIADLFELTLKYTNGENPYLRLFMTPDYWMLSQELSETSYTAVETYIEDSVQKILMKELLSSSRCFVECNHRDDAAEFCSEYNNLAFNNGTDPATNGTGNYTATPLQTNVTSPASPDNTFLNYNPTEVEQHRICPDENTVCQASCWTKKQRFNHKTALYGYASLDDYDSSPMKILASSWDHYLLYGNESYVPQNMLSQGMLHSGDTMLHLPVCYSNYTTIKHKNKDIKNFGSVFGFSTVEADFPFACGQTFRSEDTKEFLLDANVNLHSDWELRKIGFEAFLDHKMSNPIDSFLLLCQTGLRFPQKGEGKIWMRRQTHTDCDLAFNSTKYMNPFEANYHFCTSSDFKKTLNKDLEPFWMPTTPKKRCQSWMKESKSLLATLGSEKDAKYEMWLEEKKKMEEEAETKEDDAETAEDEEIAEKEYEQTETVEDNE